MILVNANTLSSLSIGRCGENLARQVVFDVSDWETEYGPGVVELIAQRPGDENPYPVAVKRDATQVIWDITSVDTAIATHEQPGKCELRYYVGDVLAKSKTWRLWVDAAMDTPSETTPSEPEQGWLDQVLSVAASAKASADAAKADADRAAAMAAQAAEKAAQTAQDATAAEKAKEAAETAKRLAEDAQRAAETAQKAAEEAKAASTQSATDAATAKSGAEAALKSAQDAAAAASQALADLRALYQEMQTWAQGVVQDVNETGSVAVQSVQSAGDAQVKRVAEEGTTQTANAKAQADAAAQSAAGAAQSAQEAAESAAVYDNVVTDVNQLKSDLSAEQIAREAADNALRADLTANTKADEETKRRLDALWKLNQGISWQFETDEGEAYSKTVPTGAKLASVESIGGKTVVWNQLVDKVDSINNDSSMTVTVDSVNKKISFVGTPSGKYKNLIVVPDYPAIVIDHKYYIKIGLLSGTCGINSIYFPALSYVAIKLGVANIVSYSNGSSFGNLQTLDVNTSIENNCVLSYPVIVDLTKMFGSGKEPTSTDDPRIAWIEQYYTEHPRSNVGELVSADVDSVKYNDDVVAEIPEAVRNLPGYGWSAGNAYNSIERTETGWQYVQRVGYKDLGSIQWEQGGSKNKTSWCPKTWRENVKPTKSIYTRANIICSKYTCDYSGNVEKQAHDKTIAVNTNSWIYIYDSDYIAATPVEFIDSLNGAMFYYELNEPIITDITDLMADFPDYFDVEAGGTITLENAAKLPVPRTEKYIISLAEVNQ